MKTPLLKYITSLSSGLPGIVVVAILLRSIGINGPFTGLRDWQSSFYALEASGRSLGTYDRWPPLTEAMYAVAMSLFRSEEWAIRVIPVLLSVGTVVLLYFFLRDLFGRNVASLGSAFLAMSPGDVFYSSIISYHFFLVLSIWMFYQWVSRGSRWAGLLACSSAVIAAGFSYSAIPIILIPVAYVSIVFKKSSKAFLLGGLIIGEVLVWLGYLSLSGVSSDLRLGVATDNVSWLVSQENLAELIKMAVAYVWRMAMPVVVALSMLWFFTLQRTNQRANSIGDGLVFWWLLGVVAWAIATPRHAATHDIWWIAALPPLSAAAARGVAMISKFRLFALPALRIAALTILAALVAYGSRQTLVEYWSVRYLDDTLGRILRTHVLGGTIIADSPATIWYAGSRGYTWKYFAQVSGQKGLEQVLTLHRPAAVLISDDLARDWRFWGDAPPYSRPMLSKFGYVPAWRVWNVVVYFREPSVKLILTSEVVELVALRSDGWTPRSVIGVLPIVRTVAEEPRAGDLRVTASSPGNAVISQTISAEPPGHYVLGAVIDPGQFDGRVRLQLSFFDGQSNRIGGDDSPWLDSRHGARVLLVAATVPLAACKVQASVRIVGLGVAVVRNISLTRLPAGVGHESIEILETTGSRCRFEP
jgi:4-amino-4-deoxy-L-arabinose transferase-like glycosyltransferase